MTELEFAALLVSRVCHDLVSPLGAVVNGLEVLEEEHDAAMRKDALHLVGSSAENALTRLQFLRLAFGAAGSAGTEVDMDEVGKMITGWFSGSRITVRWEHTGCIWPKAWGKLIMNAAMLATDCLPRGGRLSCTPVAGPEQNGFILHAAGPGARITEDTAGALRGKPPEESYNARAIQPVLAFRLADALHTGLSLISENTDQVDIIARPAA